MLKLRKTCAADVMLLGFLSWSQPALAGQLFGSNGENRWFEVGPTDGAITDINNST